MDKIEILYNHYTDTNSRSLNEQKKRNKYFCIICILEFINMSLLLYPTEMLSILSNYINTKLDIEIPTNLVILQCVIWVVIVYYTIVYFQKNIYIERHYNYISQIETELSKSAEIKSFNRESNNYNDNYPKILSLIDKFYKLIIPLFMVITNTIKIIFEFINKGNLVIIFFDTLCYTFLLIATILYMVFINKKEKSK